MTKFDPNKHKETKKRIAELGTAKEVPWQLGKPKNIVRGYPKISPSVFLVSTCGGFRCN